MSGRALVASEEHNSSPTTNIQENSVQSIQEMPHQMSSENGTSTSSKTEETLESHEVIELQTFIERKEWIEEKIRFLEKMPPIEVFVGLDAVKESAEDVPGLPTREELHNWNVEHDMIEKETEIFDKGELKKLRNITRAATQRNLSPEDTDLIELTLTTIYDLDKLLHLLRDRSDNLDLLAIRLTWEEHRISSWIDRRKIIQDLNIFLETRARFSSSAYDTLPRPDPPDLKRRGSVASLASIASTSSDSSPVLSRSVRFKLAELLSRDGATISARVTALKHGSVPAAGKALDKLIDQSRKPVPEVLLDEQDHLEEQCINEMETVGKFVMNVVMQWRKADEIYVETIKDHNAAQALLEEIEDAQLQHPSGRSSSSFISRADGLVKRLQLRGNPSLANSTFPRPVHHLFPSQSPFNESLAQSLSSDIQSATVVAKQAEAAAKDYRARYEAVKLVETLKTSAADVCSVYLGIIDRLQNGVPGAEGDGTTPSLMSSGCLDPSSHSVFLALLPSMLEELDKADGTADALLQSLPVAIAKIDFQGVDPDFRSQASSEAQRLGDLRTEAGRVRKEVSARVGRLRDARKIWTAMESGLKELDTIRREVVDTMESVRWRQETTINHGAPPTPESPPLQPLPLPSSQESHEKYYRTRMADLETRLEDKVYTPFSILSATLEDPLKIFISQSVDGIRLNFDRVQQTISLLEAIRKQSSAMTQVRGEFDDIQLKIDNLVTRYDNVIHNLLELDIEESANDDLDSLKSDNAALKANVLSFIEGLGRRVPLVNSNHTKRSVVKRSLSSLDLVTPVSTQIELPFEVQSVDDAVRVDCNSYSMRINGQLRSLEQSASHLQLAQIAMEVDTEHDAMLQVLEVANTDLSAARDTFGGITGQTDILQALRNLREHIHTTSVADSTNIERALSPHRAVVQKMKDLCDKHSSQFQDSLLASRKKRLDDVEKAVALWQTEMKMLQALVIEKEEAEVARIEAERLAEEERQRLERERLEAEELERARLERERQEEEERRKREEELARMEAERAEKERLERESAERERLEQERVKEELRLQAESKRLAAEEAEKLRFEQERQTMKMRLKTAEDLLAEERRMRTKNETDERLEMEKRLKTAEEQLAEERRIKAEKERADAEARKQRPDHDPFEEDVFGLQTLPGSPSAINQEMKDLLSQIAQFRKRLRSIGIREIVRPSPSNASLPDVKQATKIQDAIHQVEFDMKSLPTSVETVSVNIQLRSCRAELEASRDMMDRLDLLTSFSEGLVDCDAALSDLLEHIDSYPSAPLGPLSSSYDSDPKSTPEAQLSGRLDFTRLLVDKMSTLFKPISNDHRAIAEKDRILQTWSELEEMSNDRITGRRSRASSVASSTYSTHDHSSGRNSRSSISVATGPRKSSGYATLSAMPGRPNRARGLKAPTVSSRRAFSGTEQTPDRSSSSMSMRSNVTQRSTSGSSLYGSTFASRQRTSSLTPIAATPPVRSHARSQTSSSSTQKKRTTSPAPSDTSSVPRSTSSVSTWSRAPRVSFPTLPRSSPKRASFPRKPYVANPKSKLDVAVGKVVNNLPMGINIEGVAGSWKDQSGKYWIGDKDPKLCFCRILRSQTVMVRVGGGWCELSKFIHNHFADSFRLLADMQMVNLPNLPSREEKWISSSTLLEAVTASPPRPPRTPEPGGSPSLLPSFALQTPSSHSPRSLLSSPSTNGSPLTPLQFMRRAEPDAPFLRPETPSRMPNSFSGTSFSGRSMPSTPSRHNVWRP